MAKFKVYYSIFGKKLITILTASSPYHAQQIVKEKIKFIKTELIEEKIEDDDMLDNLRDMFGMK